MTRLLSRLLPRAAAVACAALLAIAQPVYADVRGPVPIPPDLFSLTSPVGQQRLLETDYKQAFWPLATYFETQRNQAYCSVATSVVALNALGIARPASSLYPDYPYFTQQDFFKDVPQAVADPAKVSVEGMTLAQLAEVLGHFPVKVHSYPADTLTVETFRGLIMDAVRYDDRFLLLNFNRAAISELGGGHWSPIGAYHPATDTVLVLDVARYKYPPLWVPLARLYEAALSVDSASQRPRGVLVVARP